MAKPSSYQILANRADWRSWLEAHYASQAELWLAINPDPTRSSA